MFDHEKLDAYKLALEFVVWVTPIFETAKSSKAPRISEACDQLDRASLSALLNIAEGNGKRQRPVRAKFFDDARGSATESAACLDALVARGSLQPERIQEGKLILVRLVSVLSKLIDRFDGIGQLREDIVEYHTQEVPCSRPSNRPRSKSRTRRRTRRRTRTTAGI